MEHCDVLIIGGGPAGSSCAWELHQRGRDVVLMDRAEFPRDKVCAGWITPGVLQALGIESDCYANHQVLQPITGFRTGTIGGPVLLTEYHDIVSYGICRCEFDDFLLRRSGARLRLGEPFRAVVRDGADWIVNDSIRAKWLIGAGGHFCPVARQFTDPETTQSSPVIVAQEVEFPMTADQAGECEVMGSHPELYFCTDLQGYGWIFRKGNILNIGLGRADGAGLKDHVAEFAAFLRRDRRIRFELPDRFHGHAYRLRSHFPAVRARGVLLVGDAAGLASGYSGEGIRPAIESGLLAAAAICDGSDPDDVARRYAAELTARLNLERSAVLADWIPQPLRAWLGRSLLKSRWFTRSVVLDRWFLDRRQSTLSSAGSGSTSLAGL